MRERARPARVLLAVEQLRRRVPGGIGSYARGLLQGLDECAAADEPGDVTLLASRAPRGGDPLAAFGRPLLASRLPGPLLTRVWDVGGWRVPAAYDVVHSVSLAAPAPRAGSRWASVVTVHDVAWRRVPEATTRRGRRWHESALRRAVSANCALVVTSQLVASDLQRDGVDPDRITIVRGGSDHLSDEDLTGADSLLERLGVRGPFLLTVGTLEPRKNIARLVDAFVSVRSSVPDVALVVVGPTGWGEAAPRDVARLDVHFTGGVSDAVLAGLYRRARAFAYVPLTEGYGLPPLEAMRAGLPAVVSREVPSAHDVGDPAPAPARLVDPLDVEDIAAGTLEVLTDDILRADLVMRGERHAAARTWHDAAHRHLQLWERLS